jgi:hypothetical protein
MHLLALSQVTDVIGAVAVESVTLEVALVLVAVVEVVGAVTVLRPVFYNMSLPPGGEVGPQV